MSNDVCVQLEPQTSVLLRDLMRFTPVIREKLREPGRWRGFVLADSDDGHSYQRLQCLDQLEVIGTGARYSIGVHRFGGGGRPTALHDHRYPFAVLPLSPSGERGALLYEMPWEYRRGPRVLAGVIQVRDRRPYAIAENRRVFHAVCGVRPHASIVIAETSRRASRPNRLQVSALSAQLSNDLRAVVLQALETVP
jgi:hypothetical protein